MNEIINPLLSHPIWKLHIPVASKLVCNNLSFVYFSQNLQISSVTQLQYDFITLTFANIPPQQLAPLVVIHVFLVIITYSQ